MCLFADAPPLWVPPPPASNPDIEGVGAAARQAAELAEVRAREHKEEQYRKQLATEAGRKKFYY